MDQQLLPYTKENAEHILDIINLWINNIDTKASYALSFTGVLAGFVLAQGFPHAFSEWKVATKLSMSIVFAASLIILLYIFTFFAICLFVIVIKARVKPFTDSKSHLFFETITKYDLEHYTQEFIVMTEEQYVKELIEQIYTNSKICSQKTVWYKRGICILLIAIALCFVCCIFQLI